MDNIALEIINVSKSFSARNILNNVSLQVKNQEIFGLVGANGIGKTTLIKTILQLITDFSGEIKIFHQTNLLSNSRSKLAYLPEKFQPSLLLKGREFILMSCSWYKKKLDQEMLNKYCEILDFPQSALDLKVGKYSKGMIQKLGLLSVFIVDVPLLILDEPMSGLDPAARIRLKKLLKEYCSKGKTIFFTTHILADIEEICDNMAIINNGSIIYQGSPNGILQKYNTKNLESAFLSIVGEI